MKRLFLVPVFGVASLAVAAAAHAQPAGWIDSRTSYTEERQSYNDARRAAYDNGYREGLKEGEKDGRRRDQFAFRDEREYQRADRGYHRTFGDVERYRQSFRSGYAEGYRDGYQRYGRVGPGNNGRGYGNGRWSTGYPGGVYGQYPGRAGYYNPAYQNGVNDGYEKGVEDARKGRTYDVLRHKWYRAGDRHYEREYGPRDQYENAYRIAFREGYERGYREGRYR